MKKKKHKNSIGRWIFVIILSIIMLSVGVMAVNAHVLHVRRAVLSLEDLPEAFDGTTILYVSDIDLCGINTSGRVADAFMQFQSLQPDVLILGGDYTSRPLWDVLDGRTDAEAMAAARRELFSALAGFQAPLGKYALSTLADEAIGDIQADFELGGFIPLNDHKRAIARDDAQLWLAGVDADTDRLSAHAARFIRDDCVICVADTPEQFPRLMTAEAADSGPWMDLCLTGGTHGGQIRLGPLTALELTATERRYLSGWTREAGVPLLVCAGMGCEAVNLRLGTRPEVWMIELQNVSRETMDGVTEGAVE